MRWWENHGQNIVLTCKLENWLMQKEISMRWHAQIISKVVWQIYLFPPSWLRDKKSACLCIRHVFNPQVGKILWRRKWQPIPVFLPGKSHRQEPGRLQSMGSQIVKHDLATKEQHSARYCQGIYRYLSASSHSPGTANLAEEKNCTNRSHSKNV